MAIALGLATLVAVALPHLGIGPRMRVSVATAVVAQLGLTAGLLYVLGARRPAGRSVRGFCGYVAGVGVSTALALALALHTPVLAGFPGGDARQRAAHGFALLGAVATGTCLVGRHTVRRARPGRRLEAAPEEPFAVRVTLASCGDEDRPTRTR